MNNAPQTVWIVVTLAAIALTQGGVSAVRARYEPKTIRECRHELQELDPNDLAGWTFDPGKVGETGIEQEILDRIRAQHAMTRTYVDSRESASQRSCSMHIAVWSEGDPWTPHLPEVCYRGAGYAVGGRKTLKLPGHPGVTVGVIRFQAPNSGADVLTMYWYQMGDQAYLDRNGARPVRRSFWGQPERPPLVKVLMQCSGTGEEDERRMLDLASAVFDFTVKL